MNFCLIFLPTLVAIIFSILIHDGDANATNYSAGYKDSMDSKAAMGNKYGKKYGREESVRHDQREIAMKMLKWLIGQLRQNEKCEYLVVVLEVLMEMYQPLREVYHEAKRHIFGHPSKEDGMEGIDVNELSGIDELVQIVNGQLALNTDHLKKAAQKYMKKKPVEVQELLNLFKQHVAVNFKDFYLPKFVKIMKNILTGIRPYLMETQQKLRKYTRILWEMDEAEQRFGQQFI